MVNSQDRVIGVGSLDRFVRRFFHEVMSAPFYLVRSDECGAHNLLKPVVLDLVQGEGYLDMSEYIQVEMRLDLRVDQIFTQVLSMKFLIFMAWS